MSSGFEAAGLLDATAVFLLLPHIFGEDLPWLKVGGLVTSLFVPPPDFKSDRLDYI